MPPTSPTTAGKPRVVKDYDKLDEAVLEQIKLTYPQGFETNLVRFKNAKGDTVSALPFETDDRYYLVRMTVLEAQQIIEDDDDYDDDGNLKARIRKAYSNKHGDDDDDDDDTDSDDGDLLGLDDDDDFDLEGDDDSDSDDLGFDDDDEYDGGGEKADGTVGLDGIDVVDPGTM